MKQVYLDDETHQELKARAAFASCKMGEYVRKLLGLGESGAEVLVPSPSEVETAPPPILLPGNPNEV